MLQLDNLSFQYTENTTRYLFSLTAEKATVVAISGKSGSGKSTLLDLIAGFLAPLSGSLYWEQKNITKLATDKRPVTTLFQKNNLFEHRNAIDNVVVGINPAIPQKGPDVSKAKKALSDVGLENHYLQRVSSLSGGQRQRVAIARALIRERGIVLLDEPLSALDSQTRTEMLSLIKALAIHQHYTVIMVTHDNRDADAIADDQYEVVDGRLNRL